jgi:hypothetical protein
MRLQVIASLGSSWLSTGLVLLFAHFARIADDRFVIASFMATAILAPIQVVLNEIVNPVAAKNQKFPAKLTILGFILIQMISVSIGFVSISGYSLGNIYVWIIVIFSCAATYLSSRSAWGYIILLTNGLITIRQSMLFGAIPGLTIASIYFIYFITRLINIELSTNWLLLQIIIPSFMQNRYLDYKLLKNFASQDRLCSFHFKLSIFLYAPILLILIIASQYLRQYLYAQSSKFGIYIIIGLNLLFTIAFTLSKIIYLEGRQCKSLLGISQIISYAFILSAIAICVVKFSLAWSWGVLSFLALQLLAVILIQEYRYRYDREVQQKVINSVHVS